MARPAGSRAGHVPKSAQPEKCAGFQLGEKILFGRNVAGSSDCAAVPGGKGRVNMKQEDIYIIFKRDSNLNLNLLKIF